MILKSLIPGQNLKSQYSAVIPKFIRIMKSGESPLVFGDGEQSRDGIYPPSFRRAYIDNGLQANEKALFTPEEQILKGKQSTVNNSQSSVHSWQSTGQY